MTKRKKKTVPEGAFTPPLPQPVSTKTSYNNRRQGLVKSLPPQAPTDITGYKQPPTRRQKLIAWLSAEQSHHASSTKEVPDGE